MKVLFLTNIPSPYRVDFFNELGKYCNLTVTFEGKKATDRDDKWVGEKNKHFKVVYLKGRRVSAASFFCPDVIKVIRKGFDQIIVSNYSDPTFIFAMAYMKLLHFRYWIEADGGLIPDNERKTKYLLKKQLIGSANHWFSSGHITTQYFLHYGAKENEIFEYPFTSLKEEDILPSAPTIEEKMAIRKKIGISGTKVVISVGQFIYRKGYDVLIKAWTRCPHDVDLYIIGGEATEEYLELVKNMKLNNLHFCGFKSKNELKEYYKAADLFVFPTREDIWGLVINEAMAAGLPIITTNKCVAGLELVRNNKNGFIVPVNNKKLLAEKMNLILSSEELRTKMGENSLRIINDYTIEKMANVHTEILENVF